MKNKVVVITGAASGIGKACAARFASEGAQVALVDKSDVSNAAAQIEAAGGMALAVSADVSDEHSVMAMFDAVIERFGRVDVLAHLAGISTRKLIPEMGVAEWDQIMDVNLKGTFIVCKAAITLMRAAAGGSIVTTGSELAFVSAPNIAAYSASKAGVVHLTRCLARDHGVDGIRVNCVCPGPIDTPMLRRSMSATADPLATQRGVEASTILGRLGKPDEIANMVHFLASDEASFITGATMLVDGGVTVKAP